MPNFTFTRDIPDAPNNPSQDQPIMQVNSNSTDSILNVDHYGFNLADGGLHRQVTTFAQGAPGLNGGDAVYYADRAIPGPGNPAWPTFQNSLGAFFLATQFPVSGLNGYFPVPGNIFVQWGFVNGTHGSDNHFNGGQTGTVLFAATPPNKSFTSIFNVFTQPLYNSSTGSAPSSQATVAVDFAILNAAGFQWTFVTNSSEYTRFLWVAIGS